MQEPGVLQRGHVAGVNAIVDVVVVPLCTDKGRWEVCTVDRNGYV